MNYLKDNLRQVECDGHVWEYGFFGEVNNGFSAFGFRQDGTFIRVTSEYETELFGKAISTLSKFQRHDFVPSNKEVKNG